jgi:hypothetical protein
MLGERMGVGLYRIDIIALTACLRSVIAFSTMSRSASPFFDPRSPSARSLLWISASAWFLLGKDVALTFLLCLFIRLANYTLEFRFRQPAERLVCWSANNPVRRAKR